MNTLKSAIKNITGREYQRAKGKTRICFVAKTDRQRDPREMAFVRRIEAEVTRRNWRRRDRLMAEAKVIEVVGGLIRRGDKYLLGRRSLGKSQGGKWEFIGGKIESSETPEQALARECVEEVALPIINTKILSGSSTVISVHGGAK